MDFKSKVLAEYKLILMKIKKKCNVDVKGNLQILEILFLLVAGNQSYMYHLYIFK